MVIVSDFMVYMVQQGSVFSTTKPGMTLNKLTCGWYGSGRVLYPVAANSHLHRGYNGDYLASGYLSSPAKVSCSKCRSAGSSGGSSSGTDGIGTDANLGGFGSNRYATGM